MPRRRAASLRLPAVSARARVIMARSRRSTASGRLVVGVFGRRLGGVEEGEFLHAHDRAAAEDGGAFHGVAELADVAGPGVGEEEGGGLG